MTAARRGRARMLLALSSAGLFVLAGCTSSTPSGADSGSPAASSSHLETAITPIPGSAASNPPTTSDPASTSPAASKTPSPSPKPTGPPACASADLKIHALRGSAAGGQEFAVVTFTNTGAGACTIRGFPRVSLRLRNAPLGAPAGNSGVAASSVVLKIGQQAEARVTDFSSCQAPLSDRVRVSAPGQSAFVDLPLELRACRVVVEPVTHS